MSPRRGAATRGTGGARASGWGRPGTRSSHSWSPSWWAGQRPFAELLVLCRNCKTKQRNINFWENNLSCGNQTNVWGNFLIDANYGDSIIIIQLYNEINTFRDSIFVGFCWSFQFEKSQTNIFFTFCRSIVGWWNWFKL